MTIRWTPEQYKEYRNIRTAKPSKYKAEPVIIDGFRFDSKMEGRYYSQLKLRRDSDDDPLQYFLRQVPFHLPGNVIYRVDFVEVEIEEREWDARGGADVYVRYVDVKGYETPEFKMKKKMVENLYPVKIEVVKNV